MSKVRSKSTALVRHPVLMMELWKVVWVFSYGTAMLVLGFFLGMRVIVLKPSRSHSNQMNWCEDTSLHTPPVKGLKCRWNKRFCQGATAAIMKPFRLATGPFRFVYIVIFCILVYGKAILSTIYSWFWIEIPPGPMARLNEPPVSTESIEACECTRWNVAGSLERADFGSETSVH